VVQCHAAQKEEVICGPPKPSLPTLRAEDGSIPPPGTAFTCVRKAVVRVDFAGAGRKLGTIEAGEVIAAQVRSAYFASPACRASWLVQVGTARRRAGQTNSGSCGFACVPHSKLCRELCAVEVGCGGQELGAGGQLGGLGLSDGAGWQPAL
jgi:hypothetical protein